MEAPHGRFVTLMPTLNRLQLTANAKVNRRFHLEKEQKTYHPVLRLSTLVDLSKQTRKPIAVSLHRRGEFGATAVMYEGFQLIMWLGDTFFLATSTTIL